MQESGLTEIITLICILTIEDQYPVFLHPESFRVNPVGGCVCDCSGCWLDAGNILCLLIRQVTFFVYRLL